MARILIIDDEERIRTIIRKILTGAGHEVVEAENGAVGTELFGESEFDLVVTDLIMPEKEGIETILHLREVNADVPILVVSGGHSFDTSGPLEDAELLGANASLAKPFSIEQLTETVDALLGGT